MVRTANEETLLIEKEEKFYSILRKMKNEEAILVCFPFDDTHLPESRKKAKKIWRNFIRRLERNSGGSVISAAVIHGGDPGRGRMHIHAVFEKRYTYQMLSEIWGDKFITIMPVGRSDRDMRILAEFLIGLLPVGERIMTSGIVKSKTERRKNNEQP